MKTNKLLILATCAMLTMSGCSGCQLIQGYKTFTTAYLSSVSSDKLVVYVEDAMIISRNVMDTFVALERKHEAE